MMLTLTGRLQTLGVVSGANNLGLTFCGFIAAGLSFAPSVSAHFIPDEGTGPQVDAAVVATWRSASVVDQYEFWQIPGTLMGGDAHPVTSGLSVDEVTVKAARRVDANTFVKLGLGVHQGGSQSGDEHQSVAVEHASLGFICCNTKDLRASGDASQIAAEFVAEIGVLSAAFTPELLSHRSTASFSEPSLIADVFFGRHFHDQGARVWLHETAGWSVGAEIWQGKAFPATEGDDGGAWDVFARYQFDRDKLNMTLGGWWYTADAQSRADHRYGGGHQHTPVAPPGESASQFPDIRYTGDVVLLGVDASMAYQWTAASSMGVQLSWAQLTMDGALHDSGGREAALEADQYAVWVQPYLKWQQHNLAVRVERLVADNRLSGASAATLGESAGALNVSGHTPQRASLAWTYQWRPQTAFRTEWIQDETLEDAQSRFTVGVIWHGSLLSGGHSHGGY